MTSRERVLLALNHKEPDRVPLDVGVGSASRFTKGFYRKLLKHLGRDEEIRLAAEMGQTVYASEEVLSLYGNDVRPIHVRLLPEEGNVEKRYWEDEKSYFMTDLWSGVFRMPKDPGYYYDIIKYPMHEAEDETDDVKFQWPIPQKEDPESLKEAQKYKEDGFAVLYPSSFGMGFFQQGNRVYGYDNWMTMLTVEPERVQKFNDALLQKKLAFYEDKFNVFGNSIDVVCESDDLGMQTGPFMSIPMMRRLIIPYMKELFAYIKSRNPDVKINLHCCGSCPQFLPDLIEIGLDAINPVQVTAVNMDPNYLKKEFGKDMVFWGGGIDTQKTLPTGTPQQVKDAVKRNMDALKKDGGFIFTPVHNVQPDVPIENFEAMMQAFRENCDY